MRLDLDSLAAAADAARAGNVGALSDEELGADAAYAANHIEAFKPDFVKVLTPLQPRWGSGDGPPAARATRSNIRLARSAHDEILLGSDPCPERPGSARRSVREVAVDGAAHLL